MVMPDLRSLPRTLIREHPEGIEKTGFRLKDLPTGRQAAGMTDRQIEIMEPHGQARGTIITPRWGEHPVPEDQFTHGQGRGPLGTGMDIGQTLIN